MQSYLRILRYERKQLLKVFFFLNLFIYAFLFFMQSVNSKLTSSPLPLNGLGTLEFNLPDPVFVVDSIKETPLRFYLFILLYIFFNF